MSLNKTHYTRIFLSPLPVTINNQKVIKGLEIYKKKLENIKMK